MEIYVGTMMNGREISSFSQIKYRFLSTHHCIYLSICTDMYDFVAFSFKDKDGYSAVRLKGTSVTYAEPPELITYKTVNFRRQGTSIYDFVKYDEVCKAPVSPIKITEVVYDQTIHGKYALTGKELNIMCVSYLLCKDEEAKREVILNPDLEWIDIAVFDIDLKGVERNANAIQNGIINGEDDYVMETERYSIRVGFLFMDRNMSNVTPCGDPKYKGVNPRSLRGTKEEVFCRPYFKKIEVIFPASKAE